MSGTWGPKDFKLEESTIWSFPDRGSWATHDSTWRGNWSPYIPRNIIERYSKEGDIVLDQFVGGGTTLIEAKLLNRNAIGVDCNSEALKRCIEKLQFKPDMDSCNAKIVKGDARKLDFISDSSVDLICTHPPYADIISYSKFTGIQASEDLSNYGPYDFLKQMEDVAAECFRVLKSGHYCTFLIGDVRKNGHYIPLGFRVMDIFIQTGFELKEIAIKEQHNCKSTEYWNNRPNRSFMLIAHEYVFVLKKPCYS